ncbi:hypothetical protein TKK_0015087 [Trichogramma kaykai]
MSHSRLNLEDYSISSRYRIRRQLKELDGSSSDSSSTNSSTSSDLPSDEDDRTETSSSNFSENGDFDYFSNGDDYSVNTSPMNSLSSSRTNISSDENLPIQAFDSVNDDSSVISCLSGHSSSDVDSAGGDWNHDNSNDDSSSDDGSSEDDSSEDEDDDQYHFADPLYPGAPISVGESLVLILTFATRFKISEVVLAALIEVISAHCIQPHKCVKSVYKLKKTLADFDVPIIKEYFCGVCFAKLDEQYCSTCNENNVRYFLRGSIIEQLHSFFKREEFRNNLNYRFDRPKLDSQNYEDIYDGSVYKSVPNNFTASPSNVTFTWNTDGLPLFKSSKIGIWPFYLMVNELPHKMRVKKENVILAGLWIGDDKPHPNLFMNSFIDELGDLFRGVYFDIPSLAQPIRVRALIISGTADLPAIALFRNTKQYNSTYGCTNCYIQTERFENVQTYPFRENLSLRTTVDNDFYAAQAYEMDICQFGVKGPTTLAKIAYNYIEGTTIDVLHNVYEGVMKKMIILWFDEEFRTKDFSLFAYTNIINDRIKALTLLPFLPRNPRKISDFRYWKGSELRVFLLVYSLPVLRGIISSTRLKHHSLLVYGISLLNSSSISEAMISEASRVLREYVRLFGNEQHYGKKYMTCNVHLLLHLPEVVRKFGPLWAINCFYFENFNGVLKSYVHGSRHPEIQICSAVSKLLTLIELEDRILQPVVQAIIPNYTRTEIKVTTQAWLKEAKKRVDRVIAGQVPADE